MQKSYVKISIFQQVLWFIGTYSSGFIFLWWVRSRRCICLVTWFCYHLIAKLGNKTASLSWPDPYEYVQNLNKSNNDSWTICIQLAIHYKIPVEEILKNMGKIY